MSTLNLGLSFRIDVSVLFFFLVHLNDCVLRVAFYFVTKETVPLLSHPDVFHPAETSF